MYTLEKVRELVKAYTTAYVAEQTNIHPHTIRSIKNNPIYNPSYDTYKKLVDFLKKEKNNNEL